MRNEKIKVAAHFFLLYKVLNFQNSYQFQEGHFLYLNTIELILHTVFETIATHTALENISSLQKTNYYNELILLFLHASTLNNL